MTASLPPDADARHAADAAELPITGPDAEPFDFVTTEPVGTTGSVVTKSKGSASGPVIGSSAASAACRASASGGREAVMGRNLVSACPKRTRTGSSRAGQRQCGKLLLHQTPP